MNIPAISIRKSIYLTGLFLIGVLVSSCGSYGGVVHEKDGIYNRSGEQKTHVKETHKENDDNYFARELDKYEGLNDDNEILLDADAYYYEDEDVNSHASWGEYTEEVRVTHYVDYNWYNPYYSSYPYGYSWGYRNWYYPRHYYHYSYTPYYNPYFYGGFYDPFFYGGHYSPYNYGGYGYYNPYYYGGYGYNAYNHNYDNRRYDQYGRRANYNANDGRRSLSSSVANVNNSRRSIIRGSGSISERINRRTSGNYQNVKPDANVRESDVRRRTTYPTRDNTVRNRTRKPNTTTKPRVRTDQNNRNVKPRTNKTKNTTTTRRTKSNSETSRSSNTRTSSGSSSSRSSSNTATFSSGSSSSSSSGNSSRSSSSSRGSSSGGRR